MRAVGAKVAPFEHHELARMAEAMPVLYKSSEVLNLGDNVGGHYRRKRAVIYCRPSCCDNAYGYCCAYSALFLCGGDTWGVAPGFILLRLQRALLIRALSWPTLYLII